MKNRLRMFSVAWAAFNFSSTTVFAGVICDDARPSLPLDSSRIIGGRLTNQDMAILANFADDFDHLSNGHFGERAIPSPYEENPFFIAVAKLKHAVWDLQVPGGFQVADEFDFRRIDSVMVEAPNLITTLTSSLAHAGALVDSPYRQALQLSVDGLIQTLLDEESEWLKMNWGAGPFEFSVPTHRLIARKFREKKARFCYEAHRREQRRDSRIAAARENLMSTEDGRVKRDRTVKP